MAEDTATDINDIEYTPVTGESAVWLALIDEATKTFKAYQDRADSIDRMYADLNRLAGIDRSREFQLFWSTIQVINPSIYARPPIPVVTPRFKDRRPLYRSASELLERSTVTAFDITDIDGVMRALRDDMSIVGRGAAWVRYDTKKGDKVCIEHIDRHDFLHEPAREWCEVGWVAKRSWMTLEEMKNRFQGKSGDAYFTASMHVLRNAKEDGGATSQQKAGVWEIWSRTEDKVVWVCEGVDVTLDEDKPHLNLEGFYPFPRPAYGTVQRGGLIPVPDYLMYKDQLEEINELTNRIHKLSEAIKAKGFYPAGGEVGDAIETALTTLSDHNFFVPIKNWSSFGSNGEPVFYWPVDVIASVVTALVGLRNEVINNVYQIVGISDIMRGSTDQNETATAQQIKAQFGSVRIRDKQNELIRIARDLVRISAEIMAEEFDQKTLLDMSQLEIPTNAEIAKQVKPLEDQAKAITQQLKQAQTDPQIQAQAQENPGQAQQMIQQAQGQVQQIMGQIEKLQATPTIEQVMKFLRDNKLRPFVLDIETDSTIQPDEDAEKQRRTEFVTALGATLQQFLPVAQALPQAGPMIGDVIKFALAPFRAGRELEGKIDEAVEGLSAQAQQPQPNPEAEALQAKAQAEQQKMQFDLQMKQADAQIKAQEFEQEQQSREREWAYDREMKAFEYEAKLAQTQADMQASAQKHAQDVQLKNLDIRRSELQIANQQEQARISMASKAMEADMREEAAERNENRAERSFERESMNNGE